MDIFKFTNYRKFLLAKIESLPSRGRGERSRLAKAAGVKTGYITQVLKGDAHFSAEQIFDIANHFALNEREAHYLLLLLDYARAGTTQLKTYYRAQIQNAQNQALNLKGKYGLPTSIKTDDLNRYFSSIDFSVVHLLLTIPKYQNRSTLLNATGFSAQRLNKILDFLVQIGLVQESQGRYNVSNMRMHLPEDNQMIDLYHSQRRIQALQAIADKKEFDFHYSSNVTISKNDFLKIKQEIIAALERTKSTIAQSEPEILCGYCIDLFEII